MRHTRAQGSARLGRCAVGWQRFVPTGGNDMAGMKGAKGESVGVQNGKVLKKRWWDLLRFMGFVAKTPQIKGGTFQKTPWVLY